MIAAWMDSTNLKPEAKWEDIKILCEEAVYYGMTAVCIHPWRLALGKDYLAGSRVKLCTVIGFPLGAEDSATKVFSARLQDLHRGLFLRPLLRLRETSFGIQCRSRPHRSGPRLYLRHLRCLPLRLRCQV